MKRTRHPNSERNKPKEEQASWIAAEFRRGFNARELKIVLPWSAGPDPACVVETRGITGRLVDPDGHDYGRPIVTQLVRGVIEVPYRKCRWEIDKDDARMLGRLMNAYLATNGGSTK